MNNEERKYKIGDIIKNTATGKVYIVDYISKMYDFYTYTLRHVPDIDGSVRVCGVPGLDTDKSYIKVITNE